jgi:hypothetical protein
VNAEKKRNTGRVWEVTRDMVGGCDGERCKVYMYMYVGSTVSLLIMNWTERSEVNRSFAIPGNFVFAGMVNVIGRFGPDYVNARVVNTLCGFIWHAPHP